MDFQFANRETCAEGIYVFLLEFSTAKKFKDIKYRNGKIWILEGSEQI